MGKKKRSQEISEISKSGVSQSQVSTEGSSLASLQQQVTSNQTPVDNIKPPELDEQRNSNREVEKSAELVSKLALDLKNVESSTMAQQPIQSKSQADDQTEDKPRDQVMADRKAKKLAAQAKKAESAAQKKAIKQEGKSTTIGNSNDTPTPQVPKIEEFATQATDVENKKTNENSKTPMIEPTNGNSTKERGGILKVRFDFKPEVSTDVPRNESTFVESSETNVHPAFRGLYAKCENHKLVGIDAICTEFIHAFLAFLQSYDVTDNRVIPQDLDESIQPQLSYLSENGTRALPLALGNLVRQLKKFINQLDPSISLSQTKEELEEWLMNFYKENIESPDQEISQATVKKLSNLSHCNILTYSWDPVVERIILNLVDQKVNVHVYIIDSPQKQGKKLLQSICTRNMPCSYGLMSSLGYFVSKCNIVLLGCSAILSNGHVVANRGSSLVALTAQAQNIPILIAAKTYKFVDKVRTFEKSSTYMSTAMMPEQLETIPDDLITALVTELRLLPATSAPAVLKIKQLANE